jgi:hypothetical protein
VLPSVSVKFPVSRNIGCTAETQHLEYAAQVTDTDCSKVCDCSQACEYWAETLTETRPAILPPTSVPTSTLLLEVTVSLRVIVVFCGSEVLLSSARPT